MAGNEELDSVSPEDVTVFIGGQKRRVVLGMKAAKLLQREYGNLGAAMAKISEGFDVERLEYFLFAMLSIDKMVTREDVTEWVESIESIADGKDVYKALGDAITRGIPRASADPTSPAKK